MSFPIVLCHSRSPEVSYQSFGGQNGYYDYINVRYPEVKICWKYEFYYTPLWIPIYWGMGYNYYRVEDLQFRFRFNPPQYRNGQLSGVDLTLQSSTYYNGVSKSTSIISPSSNYSAFLIKCCNSAYQNDDFCWGNFCWTEIAEIQQKQLNFATSSISIVDLGKKKLHVVSRHAEKFLEKPRNFRHFEWKFWTEHSCNIQNLARSWIFEHNGNSCKI